jgi:hypothetical protein
MSSSRCPTQSWQCCSKRTTDPPNPQQDDVSTTFAQRLSSRTERIARLWWHRQACGDEVTSRWAERSARSGPLTCRESLSTLARHLSLQQASLSVRADETATAAKSRRCARIGRRRIARGSLGIGRGRLRLGEEHLGLPRAAPGATGRRSRVRGRHLEMSKSPSVNIDHG